MVRSRATDVAIDVLAGLKDGQGRSVSAGVRQVNQRGAAEGRANRRVHGLQFGSHRHGNLDRLRNRADLEYGVYT